MKHLTLIVCFLLFSSLPVMADSRFNESNFNNEQQKLLTSAQANTQTVLEENTALAEAEQEFMQNQNSTETRANYARQLMQVGRYEEALTHYLWCYDSGSQYEPDYSPVRLTFLLSHISDFGSNYKPAIDALIERRNIAEKNLLSSQIDDSDQLKGIILMNKKLEDGEGNSLALFDTLKQNNRKELAAVVVNLLIPDFLAAKRYRDVVESAGNISEWLSRRLVRVQYIDPPSRLSSDPSENEKRQKLMQSLFELMKTNEVKYAGQYFTALLGINDVDQAKKVAQQIISFDSSPTTFSMLIKQAEQFGNKPLAKELSEQASKIGAEKNLDE